MSLKGIILAGGIRYKTIPHYKGRQQAITAYLRQTDDLLPAFSTYACRYT